MSPGSEWWPSLPLCGLTRGQLTRKAIQLSIKTIESARSAKADKDTEEFKLMPVPQADSPGRGSAQTCLL